MTEYRKLRQNCDTQSPPLDITDGDSLGGLTARPWTGDREESNWAIQPFAFTKLAKKNSSIPYWMRVGQ